jgi:hypothetical protein
MEIRENLYLSDQLLPLEPALHAATLADGGQLDEGGVQRDREAEGAQDLRHFMVGRSGAQGCQMAYFQTKNPNLGKFSRDLQWKILVCFIVF